MRMPLLDHGQVSDYWRAIELAVDQGYRGDPQTGHIYGKLGRRLRVRLCGGQQYPSIRLHVTGLPQSAYSVHAHKFMAFVIWGKVALAPEVQVRHGTNGVEDLRSSNLKLGSPSENQLDKPPCVRVAAARAARAAQGRTPLNAVLLPAVAQQIRSALACAPKSKRGRAKRGVVKDLALTYGVSPSTISLIGKGKSWAV